MLDNTKRVNVTVSDRHLTRNAHMCYLISLRVAKFRNCKESSSITTDKYHMIEQVRVNLSDALQSSPNVKNLDAIITDKRHMIQQVHDFVISNLRKTSDKAKCEDTIFCLNTAAHNHNVIQPPT